MKTPLLYGFYLALGSALTNLLLYFAGYHDSAEKMMTAQWPVTFLIIAISVTCLVLSIRTKRAHAPADADWGYGSALGAGTLTGLFGALFGVVFTYAYFAFINPNMSEISLQAWQLQAEARHATADQISQMEPTMRKIYTPVVMSAFGACISFFFSVLFSLIIAIFFRQKPATADGAVPPPLG